MEIEKQQPLNLEMAVQLVERTSATISRAMKPSINYPMKQNFSK